MPVATSQMPTITQSVPASLRSMKRVPVPLKCGCVIEGTPSFFQSVPVQRNHASFSSSKMLDMRSQ